MLLTKSDKKIYIGEDLREHVSKAQGLEKRDCYAQLQKYLNHPKTSKVLSLCGLRRTGKTTMAAQAICDMDSEHFDKACFIVGNLYKSMEELRSDMLALNEKYRYFFIDEITAIPDFICNSAWLSDIFCNDGRRVVLSGTDSLSLIMAGWDHLYARQHLVRTSYIPYHEFYRLLKAKNVEGVHDIDTYIKFGGTLVEETEDGNPDFSQSPFATSLAMGEYINTAISGNILHSLQHDDSIQNEHSPLRELDKEGRLQSIINRIVAYHNERITLKHLSDAEGHLNMPNISFLFNFIFGNKQSYGAELNQSDDIETLIEPIKTIIKEYFQLLHISEDSLNKEVTKAQIDEIEKYLDKIGLLRTINVETYRIKRDMAGNRRMEDKNPVSRTGNLVIVQSGMQYCIANTLVSVVDSHINELIEAVKQNRRASEKANESFDDEKLWNILQMTRDKVCGNILETVVLVEATDAANKINGMEFIEPIRAYKLEFKTNVCKTLENNEISGDNKEASCYNNEVDLVIEDRRDNLPCVTYRLFEVKHNSTIKKSQYKNLVNNDLRWMIEDHYGRQIVQRTVLYRGPSKVLSNGVIYYNVEDFLCKIGEDPNFLVSDLKAEILKEEQSKSQVQALAQTLEMDDQTQELEQEPKEDINNDDIDQCQYDATDWCER